MLHSILITIVACFTASCQEDCSSEMSEDIPQEDIPADADVCCGITTASCLTASSFTMLHGILLHTIVACFTASCRMLTYAAASQQHDALRHPLLHDCGLWIL
jgi:hypothetical protein